MNTLEIKNELLEPIKASCSETELKVTLVDGATLVVPLWWFPTLQKATPAQRADIELSPFGLHWQQIDEDISIEGLIKGWKSPGATCPAEAAE